jgi:hypothetical protein
VTRLITETAASEHAANVLPIPAAAYGLLAFTALIGLLFVAYAFRSVGTRH